MYVDEEGARLPAPDEERVRGLAIPPAWEGVWISPHDNGHLQAVGTDAAGRRQYIYHSEWRARRDEEKFERVESLGRVLPKVRERVQRDLALSTMVLPRACALAVRLLDLGAFRIGSDVYADEHGSFGLTTLCRRHVRKRRGALVFAFTGKSGVDHQVVIDDPASIDATAALRRRRGGFDELLAFKERSRWQRLTPALVNEYVRDASGLEVSAKDFRTWHATVLAALDLAESDEPGDSKASRKRAEVAAVKEVASYLGNTPAMARRAYIDPRVIALHARGRTIDVPPPTSDGDARQAQAEASLLRLMRC